ncbi:hypothetical protein RHS03_05791, partial [Rhizoctonia solani]
MLDELAAAGDIFKEALKRYHRTCFDLQKSCITRGLEVKLPDELSSRVVQEMELFSFYESTLRDARSALGYVRNTPSFTPINALPREIISQIFGLVATEEHSNLEYEEYTGAIRIVSLKSPDSLAHVCSYWREIALRSHTLWTHIDLSFDRSIGTRQISRAHTYASRAARAPLYVFIRPLSYYYHNPLPKEASFTPQFLASLAPQTGTLFLPLYKHTSKMFETFLKHCTPEVFSRLSLESHLNPADQCGFILSGEDLGLEPNSHEQNFLLDLPVEQLEDIMLHLTSLHMLDIFFPWSSKAYHNLTDLCLAYSPYSWAKISESNLVGTLRSSPLLRRLGIQINIVDSLPATTPIKPVALEHVEILDLHIESSASPDPLALGQLLRWIAPGLNPLRVSINQKYSNDINTNISFKDNSVTSFFARSNVISLNVSSRDLITHTPLTDLVNLSPSLRTLGIENFDFQEDTGSCFTPQPHSLSTLYLLRSKFYARGLANLIQTYSVQKVLLWECCSTGPGYIPLGPENDMISSALEGLLPHRPTVEYLASRPHAHPESRYEFLS